MKFLGLLFMGMAIVSLCAGEGRKTLKLKAGSYNLRYLGKDVAPNDWPNRGPRVVALLKREKFDIFGAQEAMVPQIATIESENGYRCIGRGREAGGGGEYSCIFYDPERFDCLKENTFWLSETPEAPGSRSWGSACARICTYGLFRDRRNGREFLFANTHLDHISPEARENGIALILERLKPYLRRYPAILTGDFNSFPGDKPVLLASEKLRDARLRAELAAGPSGTFHGYESDPARRKYSEPIDYLLVTPEIRVRSFRVIEDFQGGLASSDHFPLAAELEIP